jgi:hypothetical protein
MSDGPLVLLFPLELENQNLIRPAIPKYGGFHGTARNQFAAVLEGGLDGQLNFRAYFAGQFFDPDHIARSDPVLLSASFNDCVHGTSFEPGHTKGETTAKVKLLVYYKAELYVVNGAS